MKSIQSKSIEPLIEEKKLKENMTPVMWVLWVEKLKKQTKIMIQLPKRNILNAYQYIFGYI